MGRWGYIPGTERQGGGRVECFIPGTERQGGGGVGESVLYLERFPRGRPGAVGLPHFNTCQKGDNTPPGVSLISHYKPYENLPFPVP